LIFERKDIDKHREKCNYKMIGCPLKCKRKFYELEALEVNIILKIYIYLFIYPLFIPLINFKSFLVSCIGGMY
jgi:hypothetical protein